MPLSPGLFFLASPMTVYVRVLSCLVPVPVPVTVIKNTLSKSNLEENGFTFGTVRRGREVEVDRKLKQPQTVKSRQ